MGGIASEIQEKDEEDGNGDGRMNAPAGCSGVFDLLAL